MNQKDRDRLFELMIFYDDLMEWKRDKESELPNKDINKIKIITDNIIAMMIQYRKAEGVKAMESLSEEAKKYKFAILPIDQETELTGTMESVMLKGAIQRVLKNQTTCEFCDRCDYKYCEWFTLKKFLNEPKNQYKKKQCPYKRDLFENLDENY